MIQDTAGCVFGGEHGINTTRESHYEYNTVNNVVEGHLLLWNLHLDFDILLNKNVSD